MMGVDRIDVMSKKYGEFREWEDKEKFMAFRAEMFKLYDELTEEERYDMDEMMIMEHISMIYHCYVGDEED